jgi:hypothetical protein
MKHYSIWIRAGMPTLEAAFEGAQDLVCGSLLLCASVGCACIMGTGEKHCREVYHGKELRISVSEGPTWFTLAYLLRESLHLEIYLDEQPGVDQVRELERRIKAIGGQPFWSYDNKATTMEERLAYV